MVLNYVLADFVKFLKMGLLPLEFTDCLTDSPYFRENIHAHEKELDRTSQAIKGLIKEVKDLLTAAKSMIYSKQQENMSANCKSCLYLALSRAQRSLANTLNNFNFECIGQNQTDDEIVIGNFSCHFPVILSAGSYCYVNNSTLFSWVIERIWSIIVNNRR